MIVKQSKLIYNFFLSKLAEPRFQFACCSRFTSFVFLGGTAGTVLTLPLCGILLNNYPWEVENSPKQLLFAYFVQFTVFITNVLPPVKSISLNLKIFPGRLLCNVSGLASVVRVFSLNVHLQNVFLK